MKRKVIALAVLLAMVMSCSVSCFPFLPVLPFLRDEETRPVESGRPVDTRDDPETNMSAAHTYIQFNPAERNAIKSLLGEVFPFIPNDDYTLENYQDGNELGFHFYTVGNTEAEFKAYRREFSDYRFLGTAEDKDGDTWYSYQKGNLYADMVFYTGTVNNARCIDVYVYIRTAAAETPVETVSDTDAPSAPHTYNNFTPTERNQFTSRFGTVIPFVPTDRYMVDEFTSGEITGLNYYTYGNTQAEFEAYYNICAASYTLGNTYEDDYGWTWYVFQKGDLYVEMSYYDTDEGYCIDVFVYWYASGTETEPPATHRYTDFTAAEKNQFTSRFGEVIPFVPSNEYSVEEFSLENLSGLNYYTFGNTQEEFEVYYNTYPSYGYTFGGSYNGDNNTIWYVFQKDDLFAEMSYYDTDEGYCIDVFVYWYASGAETEPPATHRYTDFTAAEKADFVAQLGEAIPFVPNDEYYVEPYTSAYENGFNFYTFGNTAAEFDAFSASLVGRYEWLETYLSDEDLTWHLYQKGDIFLEFSYYDTEDGFCLDIYAYKLTNEQETLPPTPPAEEMLTNDGKGLPVGENGVYKVNFKDAAYAQDVNDHGAHYDGCPTTGAPGVLVIPVDFSDLSAASLGFDIDKIRNAFLRDGETDYYSVYDYYYLSSGGQLDLDITVLDFWFRPSHTAAYYSQAAAAGESDQIILDEALAYLEDKMDLSAFDSDNNGAIDAVILINTLDVNYDVDLQWAYQYWNLYGDENDEYYEYDGVYATNYIWASYRFITSGYDAVGNTVYDKTEAVNTYTLIHEFGHILGADDYYDTAYVQHPMDGLDVMDSMPGDHNAYTKIHYGWITSSRLVTTNASVTLSLSDLATSGDTIILANNWDPALGAYQEYFLVAYYRESGLNGGDAGYFQGNGILVYHINASLYRQVLDGETWYDVYNNNTDPSDAYGTTENLIEYVPSADGDYLYTVGDRLGTVKDDSGDSLGYTLVVNALSATSATVTFTKVA